MQFIINDYDLFIFDLDDTIVKSEKYHYKAWLQTLQDIIEDTNFTFDYNFFCTKFHSQEKDGIKNYLINELKIKNYEIAVNNKNKNYINLLNIEYEHLELVDGLQKFLELIIENKKKFVIVTNSIKDSIDFYIKRFPILGYSTKNYYREMFTNKKPDPECYLKVVSDYPIERKIGFEDSITGIKALTQVSQIKPVFINNQNYIYYNYIIENYDNLLIIKNYLSL